VELWDNLLALTEADPAFRFLLDGQTVVIDDYLAIRPEAAARVDAAIARGQIQVGPWYTLPDEFLVSGESLVRNLERGLAVGDAHGGAMRIGYLPDSFGHAAQMPQLYHQFGLTHAVVWRGVPSDIRRTAFDWEAPDGTVILTAYMASSYSHGSRLPMMGDALAERLRLAMRDLAPFDPGEHILLMNGNDHVLPQPGLSAATAAAGRALDGTQVRLARLDDYLAQLPKGGWPRWTGELRSSARANVLMGTLSVRIADKQLAFQAARDLERRAEPLAALTGIEAGGFLREAWTLMLENAAHDTACGSGIDAVADEARLRSESVRQIAAEVAGRALARLTAEATGAGAGVSAVVWNPSPFPRSGLVECDLPVEPSGWLAEHRHGTAPTQPLAATGRHLVPTGPIAGCSWSRIRLRPVAGTVREDGARVRVGPESLANDRLTCRLGLDGRLSVVDLDSATEYDGLNQFVDGADAGDEYNYSPPPQDRIVAQPATLGSVRSLLAGPHRGRLEAQLRYQLPARLTDDRRGRSREIVEFPITVRVSLDADSPQLDVEVELENRAEDHRLRVHFPVPFALTESAADTAYHVTRRAVRPAKREAEAPEWELPTFPMRTFVDASDGQRGLALITEGLHEYEILVQRPVVLALTLLRAVGWLSRNDLAYRAGHAGPALPTPGAQVQGRHRFGYSLRFHQHGWEAAGMWRQAEATTIPLELAGLQVGGSDPVQAPARIGLAPRTIQMTACTPAADGYVLRLLNASDGQAEGQVTLHPSPREVHRSDLAGSGTARLAPIEDGYQVVFRPWEIVTLRVRG